MAFRGPYRGLVGAIALVSFSLLAGGPAGAVEDTCTPVSRTGWQGEVCSTDTYEGDCEAGGITVADCGDGVTTTTICSPDAGGALTCSPILPDGDQSPSPQGTTGGTVAKVGAGGDPVSADGSLAYQETDFSVPGLGLPITFVRTYNSKVTYNGPLGWGWDHNFNQKVYSSNTGASISCDGSVSYEDGSGNVIQFIRGPNGNAPGDGSFSGWVPAKGGRPLELSASASGTYVIQDLASGIDYTFGVGGKLSTIDTLKTPGRAVSKQYRITVNWDTRPGRVRSIQDTAGRFFYFNYTSDKQYLTSICQNSPCTTPLVSFQINTDKTSLHYGELAKVIKGTDNSGHSYQYMESVSRTKDTFIPTAAIRSFCQSECYVRGAQPIPEPYPYICQPSGGCESGIDYCYSLDSETYAQCVQYQVDRAYRGTCLGCDMFENCRVQETPETQDALNDCLAPLVANANGECTAGGINTWIANSNSCFSALKANKPYCNTDTNVFDCQQLCQDHWKYPGGEYSFGRHQDLDHNLLEVDDANGSVILKNVYGTDVGNIDFDRVVDQQWGNSAHVTFEYHDFDVENSYPTGPTGPSPADPVNTNIKSFVSLNICPNFDGTNVDVLKQETESDVPHQKPAYATLIHDLYGVARVQWYSDSWNLLRETNLSTGETINYNYSNGYVTGILNQAGGRTCTLYTAHGMPANVVQYPAPGYAGATTSKGVSYYYDSINNRDLVTQQINYGNGYSDTYTFQRDDYGRMLQYTEPTGTQILTTIYNYDSGNYFPHWYQTPNGNTVAYSNPDSNTGLPGLIQTGTGGDARKIHMSYDSFWSVPYARLTTDLNDNRITLDETLIDAPTGRIKTTLHNAAPLTAFDQVSYTYSSSDQPSSIARANLTTTALTYDSTGHPIEIRETPVHGGVGKERCNQYGPDGRLLATLNPEGDTTAYYYDGAGRVTSTTRGYDSTFYWSEQCVWYTAGPEIASPSALQISGYQYSTAGLLIGLDRDGVHYNVKTDGFGRVIEIIDPMGRTSRRGYDYKDRIIWEALYFDGGNGIAPYSTTPSFGDKGLVSNTETLYDPKDRVISTYDWHVEDSTKRLRVGYSYDDINSTLVVNENGHQRTKKFSPLGHLVDDIDSDGHETAIFYSQGGLNVSTSTPRNGGSLIDDFQYDGNGNLLTRALNFTTVTSQQTDIYGHVLSRTQQKLGTQSYQYDDFGRMIAVLADDGTTIIQKGWDREDRLHTYGTAPQGGTSFGQKTFNYDGLGRVGNEFNELNQETVYSYAGGSNRVTTKTLSTGISFTNVYDAAGLLSQASQHLPYEPNDIVKKFTYDPSGKIASAAILNTPWLVDNTTWFTYDSFGRPITETNNVDGVEKVHAYDLNDNWETTQLMNLSDGSPVQRHTYDAEHRLISVSINNTEIAKYVYYGLSSLPHSISYPLAHQTTSYTYDSQDRQIGLVLTDQAGQTLASFSDVLGTDSNLRQRISKLPGSNETLSDFFQFNSRGMLIGESLSVPNVNPVGVSGQVDNFSVAAFMQQGLSWKQLGVDYLANNRTVQTQSGPETVSYNVMNQVTQDTDSVSSAIDGDQNSSAGFGVDVEQVVYDGEKHPVRITKKDGSVLTFSYDALGRRLGESTDPSLAYFSWYHYIWDGPSIVAHCPYYFYNETLQDIRGTDLDDHIAYFRNQPIPADLSSALTYTHQRADKSVVALSNSTGIVATYNYSAYGIETAFEAQQLDSEYSRFQFQGQWHDASVGTYYMRHREYSPRLGRFVSADPLGVAAGPNHYAFASGNPMGFIDPLGLDAQDPTNGYTPNGFAQQWVYSHFADWANPSGPFGTFSRTPIPILGSASGLMYNAGQIGKQYMEGGGVNWKLAGKAGFNAGILALELTGAATAMVAPEASPMILAAEGGAEGTRVAATADVLEISEEALQMAQSSQNHADALMSLYDPIKQNHAVIAVEQGYDADGQYQAVASVSTTSYFNKDQYSYMDENNIQPVRMTDPDMHAEVKTAAGSNALGIERGAMGVANIDICETCADVLPSLGYTPINSRQAIKGGW